jgi:hypothetical protein
LFLVCRETTLSLGFKGPRTKAQGEGTLPFSGQGKAKEPLALSSPKAALKVREETPSESSQRKGG